TVTRPGVASQARRDRDLRCSAWPEPAPDTDPISSFSPTATGGNIAPVLRTTAIIYARADHSRHLTPDGSVRPGPLVGVAAGGSDQCRRRRGAGAVRGIAARRGHRRLR